MPIDIDQCTEDELHDLFHRISERLRMFRQMRAHGTMVRFSIGERVAFMADRRRIFGMLARYNRKTVTVIADGGHRWNVSPGLLESVDSAPVRGTAPKTTTAASHLRFRSDKGPGVRT